MRRYTNRFINEHNLISGRVLSAIVVLPLSLTIAACSQPNATTADSKPATEPTTATQTALVEQPQAEIMPVSAHSDTQPTILKNISVTVYKDANCGCCKEWVGYAEGHGLNATAQNVEDVSLFKERYSVPQQMRSCHTTVTTDGYVFEGHVPAKYMAQFLKSPPSDAIGLAVPSMPVGSPGMEYQDKFMPYKVMQINKDGSIAIYATIDSPQQQI
ncbi:DUF411 domain-containing protein [Psychrobacter sp. APC 3279]|uniref:DUF411 domain-containing protein n=1 Tax=Psychrobacter sp. APC 3279 TaxID=3035189 RepID=UPI0025B5B070|nr:DUF411 domain-containing protein [Psychrobacter sp. APC 3279]MDN3441750.1 DUF411 domain-containing protein [Psychrobacter sp. APC 3279]